MKEISSMSKSLRELSFESVGGLQGHIETLKEMIIYPLLYRELFDSYGIQAPRGVLFYGPPGTGKTLMAGALASECSKCCDRKVAFYMKKGGECLNKYVGESEKQLQNLFNQAFSTRPSIIFFDEIDGLVPTRSDTQEQVHASIVSTLLALMDGLDTKSEVFVIGATNRIDMIDPALRRPGRFDRELYFPLPALESRLEIFKIHTSNWRQKPSEELLLKLAAQCSGYCGADIQSLCSQAVMEGFKKSYPQVMNANKKLQISLKNINVKDEDFWEAKNKLIPASQRTFSSSAGPLSPELEPLLKRSLDESISRIKKLCPFCFMNRNDMEFSKSKSLSCPRFLLIGKPGLAHISHIAPAILHYFDHLPAINIDLTSINEDGSRASDSSSFVRKIEEARQSMPSIIYIRNITAWWNLIDEPARQVLISSLEGLDTTTNSKIFIFGSASVDSHNHLPADIKHIFPKNKSFEVTEPTPEEKKNFFKHVIVEKNLLPPKPKRIVEPAPVQSLNDFSESDFEIDNRNHIDKLPSGRLRNGKGFRPAFDDSDIPSKKVRLEISYSPSCSHNGPGNKRKCEIIVNVSKLEKLIDYAVKVTSKARVSSMIRLYEELEIISLKYASKTDRSSLPLELEREISIFSPT